MTCYSLSSYLLASTPSCAWESWCGRIKRPCRTFERSQSETRSNCFPKVLHSSYLAIRPTNSSRETRSSYSESPLVMTPMGLFANISNLTIGSSPFIPNFGCAPMVPYPLVGGSYAVCAGTSLLMSVDTPCEQGGVTALAQAGIPPHIIQAIGCWASDTFQIYIHQHPVLLAALLFSGTSSTH